MRASRLTLITWLAIVPIGVSGCDPGVSSADINSNFRIAAGLGNKARVQGLIEQGAEVNSRGPGGRDVPSGGTALMLAAARGYIDVVRLLLSHGADPNLADEGGGTALIYTVWKGHTEIVRVLLEHGADPEAATRDGRTALRVARRANRDGLVMLLEEHGATR